MILRKFFFRSLGVSAGLLLLTVVLPLSFPKPLFANSVAYGSLSLHANTPIPTAMGQSLLQDIDQRLQESPLSGGDREMQIYVADNGLLRRWLWLAVPAEAGGFIIAPLTRNHAFFSGADFQNNQLIGPSGYRPEPPRDLAYYGAHELTHVSTAHSVGTVRFHRMPAWIKEGLADYVAMPRESASSLYASIGSEDADLEMMRAFGVYAPYRLLVAYFLDEENWSIERLLQSDMSLEEARAIAFHGLSG